MHKHRHPHDLALLTAAQHGRLLDLAKRDAHRLRDEAIDAATTGLLQGLRRAWAALRGHAARLLQAMRHTAGAN